MTVKKLIWVLDVVRAVYEECCSSLQQVRDELLELEANGGPWDISLKIKERALSERKAQLGGLINELTDLSVS